MYDDAHCTVWCASSPFAGVCVLCAVLCPLANLVQAVRVNSIKYTNKMNMNNGEKALGHKPVTRVENGVFHTEAARHPYEFPRRKPFEKFMSAGIVPMPRATT